MVMAEDKTTGPRLDIRIDAELQRIIRLAAAIRNMSASQWVRETLKTEGERIIREER